MPDFAQDIANLIRDETNDKDVERIIAVINRETRSIKRGAVIIACAQLLGQTIAHRDGASVAGDMRAAISKLIDGYATRFSIMFADQREGRDDQA